MKPALYLLTSAVIGAASIASAADAATILYRNDYNVGTDFVAAALSGLSHTVTSTGGDLSGISLSSFDLVIYANQNYSAPGGDISALDAYIASGGKVIFANWRNVAPSLDAVGSGATNLTSLSVSGPLAAGLSSPLGVVNTGWGTFSTGLVAGSGGTVAAKFENGDAGIVIGNGGNTIYNGFLTDTVASSQLYSNEIGYVLGAVPEPATWAMMIAGFGLAGASLRRRRTTVRFAI